MFCAVAGPAVAYNHTKQQQKVHTENLHTKNSEGVTKPRCVLFVGTIGASIVAMSPRNMLDLNPALAMSKPTFHSRTPSNAEKLCKKFEGEEKSLL